MKLCSLMMIPLAVVVAGSAMTFQASLADDTNAANPATIEFEFGDAPCWAIALWHARLTAEPVLVPVKVDFRATYRTEKKLTKDGAIECLAAILRTNGLSFANVDHRYYRVVKESVTSPVVDHPHVDVVIQDGRCLVDGSPVSQEELPQTLARMVRPETEIWIHHPGPKSQPFSSIEIAERLRSAPGINADRIYLECMP